LLTDSEVDAVYIATPPHLHRAQTEMAARSGKDVLVEKPMALNAGECDAMVRACHEAGVRLHVAYYRRFYPKFVEGRRLLSAGAVGQILGARLQMCAHNTGGGWRTDPRTSGGGHFVDVGSHRLDMLLYLLGDAAEVQGFSDGLASAHAAEEDVVLTMRMTNRALVSASFHFHTRPSKDILEIYGTDGTLIFDPFDGPSFTLRTTKGESIHTFENPQPTHGPFVQALVDVYRGRAEDTPHVTGEEGAKVTRIMDVALAARYGL
jgi:predicted dehydrogenase